MHFRTWALAALLLVGTAALAADPPSPPNVPPTTDWVPDETIVVTGQSAGPAFWHIKKGESEIWILGTVRDLPWKFVWNQTHVAEIIDGARVVLAPPEARAGLFETSWFLLLHRGLLSMPGDKKLEETLPPDLNARFVAARTALNLKADHFEDDPPIVAAWKLKANFDEQHKLGGAQPFQAIAKIAKAKHVEMRPIGIYGGLGFFKELLRMPEDQQQTCLALVVGDTEARAVHAVPAAEAWAVGNIREIKAHYIEAPLERCAGATPSFAKLRSQAVASTMAAIDEALAKPGKTVMMVDIGVLLKNTGVAEQLHAKGVTIEGPAE